MKVRSLLPVFLSLCSLLFVVVVFAGSEPLSFTEHCATVFNKSGQCPEDICRLDCLDKEVAEEAECDKVCVPRECTGIAAEKCPAEYCEVMTNCSDQKICHYKMVGEKPLCGDLAYSGQDVECCEGLVRRCGIEFLDGTCDMEGNNSVYNLPVCVPCGNGICGQFENRCNCPEDCGVAPDIDLIEGILINKTGK